MYPVSVEAENVGISAETRILSLKRFCSSSPFFFAARLRHPAYHAYLHSTSCFSLDPHIKVAGIPGDVKKARQMILSVLDVKVRGIENQHNHNHPSI